MAAGGDGVRAAAARRPCLHAPGVPAYETLCPLRAALGYTSESPSIPMGTKQEKRQPPLHRATDRGSGVRAM